MRLLRLLFLLTALTLLPAAALADKTITITFTGDVTLGGEDYLRDQPDSFHSVYDANGPEYFLSNMADFFAEDDLTIVNLEGVLTDRDTLPAMDKGKGTEIGSGYWFRGRTEFVKVLTSASVEAASLANNHALDYGEPGLQDTIDTLENAGIEWFATRDKNASGTEKFFFYEKDGVTVCFMSLYWDDYLQGDPNGSGAWMSEQIKAIKAEGKADAVVAILHGGQEYGRHRTRPQTVFTAMAMRAGADLVICHHAHVVMGMDVIGSRSAFYSLGNFCFGGNRNAYQVNSKKKVSVQDAAPALVVRAVLTFDDDGTYKGQQMTLYPVQTTSIDRNGGDTQPNNFQPKFITGELGAHVLHLMQIDMNYDLKDKVNKELKAIVVAKEDELSAMDSSEGMASLTLPYLPAE
ncbi:MAG: CapA family protein [Clostridia bacterium]|nr:CapA family protein [Clostridia bacterium]